MILLPRSAASLPAVARILFTASAFTSAVPIEDSAPGVTIRIISPVHGKAYDATGQCVKPTSDQGFGGDGSAAIFASVDISVSDGDVGDALRAEGLEPFELCITWDAALHDSGSGDGIEGIHCKGLADPGELPNLVLGKGLGELLHFRGAGPARDGLTFRAWLRRVNDEGGLVTAESSYRLISSSSHDRESVCGSSRGESGRERAASEVSPCTLLVGVVLSGTLRTFVSQAVRDRFVAAMASLATSSGNRSATRVELLAHVPLAVDDAKDGGVSVGSPELALVLCRVQRLDIFSWHTHRCLLGSRPAGRTMARAQGGLR